MNTPINVHYEGITTFSRVEKRLKSRGSGDVLGNVFGNIDGRVLEDLH